jgi:dolichol-phosphate mannosyltransferase
MDGTKILVMLPTYNERENVTKMCQELTRLNLPMDILFVDDNSPDGTGAVLDELARTAPRVRVLHRPGKQGIGSAHTDGIRWVHSQGYTHLITMDCDFTHSPENIPDFLKYSEGYDIVVGSRHLMENSLSGWSLWRKCITRTGHLLTTLLLKMPYDATGAFRLYRLDRIPIGVFGLMTSKGYSFFIESLTILNLNGYTIKEVPIALPPRTMGHSKLQLRDMIQWGLFMIGMAWGIRFNHRKYLVSTPKS